jgi:hypothetical protein
MALAGVIDSERTAKNAIAEQTINLYIQIEVNREQIRTLAQAFIKPLVTVANDPKMAAAKTAIDNMVAIMKGQLLQQEYALMELQNQFRLLTGVRVGRESPLKSESGAQPVTVPFLTMDVIPFSVSYFSTPQAAIQKAYSPLNPGNPKDKTLTSPALDHARLGVAQAKNGVKMAIWTPFGASIGYGPTYTNASIAPGVPNASVLATALSYGGQASTGTDAFAPIRSVKSARHGEKGSEYALAAAGITLEGQLNRDWLVADNQAATYCLQKQQVYGAFTSFGKLVEAIENNQPYDASTAINLFTTTQTLYVAYLGELTAAMTAVTDMHAQVGDLLSPEAWDFGQTPGDVCAAVAKRNISLEDLLGSNQP